MEKIDFMNYRALAAEVRQLRAFLIGMERSLASVSSPQFSVVPKGPRSGGSALENRVIRYLDVQALYHEKLAEKFAQLVTVEEAIDSLEDPAERLVMRLRYLEGRSWASVCARLQAEGFSDRQVYRLHGYALKKLKEV